MESRIKDYCNIKKYSAGYFNEGSIYFDSLDYKNSNLDYLLEKQIIPLLGNNHRKKPMVVLDVGCACGSFLGKLDGRGFKTFGIDISSYAVKEAAKRTKAALQVYDVNHGLPYNNESFNLVFALDVIEHVLSPYQFAHEACRVLKKNGLLFIHTPNINSIFEKFFGKKWFGYKDSTHLYLFNRKNLAFLLEKAGFEIVAYKTITYPLPKSIRNMFSNTDWGGSLWLVVRKK